MSKKTARTGIWWNMNSACDNEPSVDSVTLRSTQGDGRVPRTASRRRRTPRRLRSGTVALALALALGVFPACAPSASPPANSADGVSTGTAPETTPASTGEAGGAVAADFELVGLDGEAIRLTDLKGQVVLLDFWATWCDPCLGALPHIEELYEKHKDAGFVVLGISTDGPESVSQVRRVVRRLGLKFPILLDSESEVNALYNPKTSLPFSALVNRDGRIVLRQESYTPGSQDKLEAAIESALAAGSAK